MKVSERQFQEKMARRIALGSIFLSAILAATKIYVGVLGRSTAVVSDGFESGGDVLASGFVLWGLTLAAKPADAEHPYGHGRFETLTGLAVGMLLCATGALICYRSFQKVFTVEPAPALYTLWPIGGSIVLKLLAWWFKRFYGQKIGSDALLADSWNDAVDMLSGLTALLAVGLSLADPVGFRVADPIGGIGVGLIVVFLGVHVVHDMTLQLMDTMPPPALLQQIRDTALGVPGALAVEKCFARKTGLQYHVDLHLEVDPSLTVLESHEIARHVRNRIKDTLDWVADVLVHVEPH